MTTVKRFKTCKISVYTDHGAPHFHIRGTDINAVIDIETMTLRAGNAFKAHEALDWARNNRNLLLAEWTRLNTKG
ncbi:MAG: DUF4160 domain-containing protein [Alphaproteobacteria bacterium]|nr:DUF4160 domain-containing protein [Alphaproteobacteria bacterium]